MDNIKEMIKTTYSDLLNKYNKIMYLKIFVDCSDNRLNELYKTAIEKHNTKLKNINNLDFIDAGFDLYSPLNENTTTGNNLIGDTWYRSSKAYKIDFNVKCSAKMIKLKNNDELFIYNTGYYMYPRSSLSKTELRLANSVGIIDAGYRGNLCGMFDVLSVHYETFYERYLQICAPGLIPIVVELVNSVEELGEKTERGEGGFGSTGK
jgi:dUTPase